MKILVIAHFQNDSSPTAMFVHDQIKELKLLGNEMLVISAVPIYKNDYHGQRFVPFVRKEIIDGIEHIFFRYFSFFRFGIWGINARSAIRTIRSGILKEIKAFSPDVIHSHTIGFDSEIGGWIKAQIDRPLVVTIHGSDAEVPIEKKREELLLAWCSKADIIVTVSSKIERKLKKLGLVTNTATILNGYIFKEAKTEKRKEHSIIQVGNLISSKNHETTVRAFAEYRKFYPDAILTIVGKGPREAYIRNLCKTLNVDEAVFFVGYLANIQVLSKMAEASYFIMPSSPEGFGIVYLEAMSSMCITVGTIGEGIEDLIVDGYNGFLVRADDYETIAKDLIWCEEHPIEAESIRRKGYESVSSLKWSDNASSYNNIYESLV